MAGPGPLFIAGQEWIFVIVVAVILLFGAKKIPELARTFGKAKGEYEKGKIQADKELGEYRGGGPQGGPGGEDGRPSGAQAGGGGSSGGG